MTRCTEPSQGRLLEAETLKGMQVCSLKQLPLDSPLSGTVFPTIIHFFLIHLVLSQSIWKSEPAAWDKMEKGLRRIHKATGMLVQERVELDKYRTQTPALESVLCRGFNHAHVCT